jgi:hypothetical protein
MDQKEYAQWIGNDPAERHRRTEYQEELQRWLHIIGDQARVYADVNKQDRFGNILLTTIGTMADLERLGLTLTDGLHLRFWMEDVDEHGQDDPILFEGTAFFDQSSAQWKAKVDPQNIRWASERKTSSS